MKVLTLLNEKGGVGKTTLAIHIAAGLAKRGKRVVLIDADAQANATTALGITPDDGLYQLLVKMTEWSHIWRAVTLDVLGEVVNGGTLAVLPSNESTRVIPMLVDDALLLRERIQDVREWAEVVVIDTPPTPSMLHLQVYMATDFIVYPTTCEMLSLGGLRNSMSRMESLNKNRRVMGLGEVQLLGVQPVMFDARTNAHGYGVKLVAENFGDKAWPFIRMRTAWRDASWAGQLLFSYNGSRDAARARGDAWNLVDRVQKEMEA